MSEHTLYNDLLRVTLFILVGEFEEFNRDPNAEPVNLGYQKSLWEPVEQLLTNVEEYVAEESPMTLRYLFIAAHDLTLAHLLHGLGHFDKEWSSVAGLDFNASLRYEVFQTVLYTESDPEAKPEAFLRVTLDDQPLTALCRVSELIEEVQARFRAAGKHNANFNCLL